ncbi:OsmC family protein [Solirubrobacter ginsenosidimutans]|uniref:OsmC family protein n=1 Tax=Solirubrobacter ginsenosidimutans TaxID=490573 RepID=A0A9X3MUK6_9ACTN|nr:OsmC family protein [Solirubrobacter ginsenosidimutans]MDA0161555.1 OsmC family protein [Solirubrobacter ginsenosidimutans]
MSITAAISANEEAIGGDAGRARVVFKTEGSLAGPTHVKLVSRDHALEVDEPDVLGGTDQFANPVEYALASLASCQAITYRFWAAKLGIALDGLEVAAEGDLDLHGFFGLDSAIRPGFTGIRLDVTPIGPESAERYRELADAVDAHCPVLDLFVNATPVERRLAVTA